MQYLATWSCLRRYKLLASAEHPAITCSMVSPVMPFFPHLSFKGVSSSNVSRNIWFDTPDLESPLQTPLSQDTDNLRRDLVGSMIFQYGLHELYLGTFHVLPSVTSLSHLYL